MVALPIGPIEYAPSAAGQEPKSRYERPRPFVVTETTVPTTKEEYAACLADPMWRLCSGQLYWIMIKSDTGEGSRVPFIPKPAQRRLIKRLWHRNIILKARQLGFTTLIAIMWLDHALFNPDQRCGIVAQDKDKAQEIFRDKVRFAYDNLPEALKAGMPLKRDSASELHFAHNNSAIKVSTSVRGGTYHRMHVSEFGKIGAKYPDKAIEVITGSLPAVPLDGIAIIESTAEGQSGEFFEMTKKSREIDQLKRPLNQREYRFHFYPWWKEALYKMHPEYITITAKDHEYFDKVEGIMRCQLTIFQRAWYCATRDADFRGDPEKMWSEYPSTPDEAFQVSTEGTYYAVQLARARQQGRIGGHVPLVSSVPVNTFWDIGNRDGTGIWCHQKVGLEHRFLRYFEGWGEPYSYFIKLLQDTGYVFGEHYLPHDAEHERQMGTRIASPLTMLEELQPGWRWRVVDRVDNVLHGINTLREKFDQAWFDEEGCKDGIQHIAMYRKEFNTRTNTWSDRPRHDEHSEAADSLRQWAQGWQEYAVGAGSRPVRNGARSSAMVV